MPATYFAQYNRMICSLCGRGVSYSFGTHPKCRKSSPVTTTPTIGISQSSNVTSSSANVPLVLPTFEEVMARKVAIIKHIPKANRKEWSSLLVECLRDAAHFNDIPSWTKLAMLAKCILIPPTRGETECLSNCWYFEGKDGHVEEWRNCCSLGIILLFFM